MKKLQKQKITNLVNYKQFLKNNNLKKYIYKAKNIIFEDYILYNNLSLEANIIEFNNYENLPLPFTLIKIGEISTIDIKYENMILFNYNLTYNILYQFNKIMFKISVKKNINLIKGRVLGGNWNNKKILISIFGFIFSMKPMNLNNALNYKKKNYFNKYNKKNYYKNKINSTRLINCYKIKYLNFQINSNTDLNRKKNELSRLSYLQKIYENKKFDNYKFKKKKFSFKSNKR